MDPKKTLITQAVGQLSRTSSRSAAFQMKSFPCLNPLSLVFIGLSYSEQSELRLSNSYMLS